MFRMVRFVLVLSLFIGILSGCAGLSGRGRSSSAQQADSVVVWPKAGDSEIGVRQGRPAPAPPATKPELRPEPAAPRLSGKAFELYTQARQLERENRLPAAVALYLQAAAAAPDEPLILTGLGMSYLQSGDLSSARLHLSRAVHLDGRNSQARIGLGYVFLQQQHYSKAIAELSAGLAIQPTPKGHYLLAEAYEKSNQKEQALKYYRSVVSVQQSGTLGASAAERIRFLEAH